MLSQSMLWRKKHGVDKILSEYELPTVAKEYFPGKTICFLISMQKINEKLLEFNKPYKTHQ